MKKYKRNCLPWLLALTLAASLAAGIWWYAKKNKITLKSLFASTGNSPVMLEDYEWEADKVTLTLANGQAGKAITVELRREGTVIAAAKVNYGTQVSLTTKGFGYLDVFVDNTDLGSIYVPQLITGAWKVQKAKCVDETGVLDLRFDKTGNRFTLSDARNNAGWANVEYWHGATFLGSTLPADYAIEPLTIHHITKKRWGNFPWLGADNDGLSREMAQLTFKIVPA